MKYGERVKITGCHVGATDLRGQTGTVSGFKDDQLEVKIEGGSTWLFWPDELEVIEE